MKMFSFKINNSQGEEFILDISATDFFNARNEAFQFCYRAGFCFIGRI